MKNNRIYFIIIIILLIVAGILYISKKSGTIKKELRDFAILDTSSVSKIFMVNKQNKSVLLERGENNIWKVNDRYRARKDAVELLLKTFKRWDVKSPVANAAFENVVKNLAAVHVKVEIYSDDKNEPAKVIFIGGPTQDMYGTYMMLENSNTPFIVHIPGFSGYLSSRFFLDENDWRDPTIFKYSYDEIKSVSVENFKNQEQSFTATNLGDNQYTLTRLNHKEEIKNYDILKVKQYLSYYKKLGFERIADDISKEKRDSVLESEPIYKITLNDINGTETTIAAHIRPSNRYLNDFGEVSKTDPERMFGQIDNDTTLVIIQYFVFDPLFMDIDYFRN
ncbi:MAG: DUF4340 domain-containing protein [Bacteroidota bacterium]|nr:DUF4340 domain-containing protein [Bacteroidota bacterium]